MLTRTNTASSELIAVLTATEGYSFQLKSEDMCLIYGVSTVLDIVWMLNSAAAVLHLQSYHTGLPPSEDKFSHVFFPAHYTNYKGPKQVKDESHPDYKAIREENERDKRALQRFLDFANSVGAKLDASQLEWSYLKELHPTREWRNVCLLRLPQLFDYRFSPHSLSMPVLVHFSY